MNRNAFFAFVHRIKFIQRWGLMRNTSTENLKEHSYDVAVIAHGIATIGTTCYGREYNPDRICASAMFHDINEALTGDMPTPVKYSNPVITRAYKDIEAEAGKRLLGMLPDGLSEIYRGYMDPSPEERLIIKAADKISAYVKCLEEKQAGNRDFKSAELALKKIVEGYSPEEIVHFVREFLPAYGITLDEIEK
ncbi:MAG: 5'-deoxynucleotidase [Clostridia bacterium]